MSNSAETIMKTRLRNLIDEIKKVQGSDSFRGICVTNKSEGIEYRVLLEVREKAFVEDVYLNDTEDYTLKRVSKKYSDITTPLKSHEDCFIKLLEFCGDCEYSVHAITIMDKSTYKKDISKGNYYTVEIERSDRLKVKFDITLTNKSCWSCKYCINEYHETGLLDCKKFDDMTEDEIEDYYTNHGGENCAYYVEDYSY